MNNTFNGWGKLSDKNLDEVSHLILTNKKACEFFTDDWLYDMIGFKEDNINVLDFGCGIGRNSFGMALHSPIWNVVGYDNQQMINKTSEYQLLKYGNNILPSNLTFSSNWDMLKESKFDGILCCLVLQHIHESDLNTYLTNFKKMTKIVIVHGRRFNDDIINGVYKNTWKILENNGFYPIQCYGSSVYSTWGDESEHFTCIYNIN
jgi:2-polyprenyl-3-methyl-5-hydroxy-6-metoxy-1,4-benzoquinol methylase